MPNSSDLSRRNVLKPLAAGLVAATVAVPLASAATPDDPIYAAIEEHRAANDRWHALISDPKTDDTPQAHRASQMEASLWERLLVTKPTTLAGVAAFAEYVVNSPVYWCLYEGDDSNPMEAIPTILAALRNILAMEA